MDPSQIHLNPKLCVPRNIYVNKSLISFFPSASCSFGFDRIHYNPKFFNNTANPFMRDGRDSFKKNFRNDSIHINPSFIPDDRHVTYNSKLKAPNVQHPLASSALSGIHINPMFLKNNLADIGPSSLVTDFLDEKSTTSVSSASLLRLVSKYKIVKKKVSSVNKHFSHFMKFGGSQFRKNNVISQGPKKISVTNERQLKNDAKDFGYQKIESSEFKLVKHNKLVRKSVLQKQIESRRCVRKVTVPGRYLHSLKFCHHKKIYKFNDSKIAKTLQRPTAKKILCSKENVKRNSSFFVGVPARFRQRNLQKVNEPCPFYHRYGRCKRKLKGTCWKVHDPKYIAICKRYIKGQCEDDKCSLSHDIRPEKMPTCHHYLAGLCHRTECPYLHIRVNPRAPICRAFLQGFCPDVFNCSKRHEYICPVFAEKGVCPRERRSCPFPHKSVSPLSKLLQADEVPLLTRSKAHRKCKPNPSETSMQQSSDNEYTSKEFKRYFLSPMTAIESESEKLVV